MDRCKKKRNRFPGRTAARGIIHHFFLAEPEFAKNQTAVPLRARPIKQNGNATEAGSGLTTLPGKGTPVIKHHDSAPSYTQGADYQLRIPTPCLDRWQEIRVGALQKRHPSAYVTAEIALTQQRHGISYPLTIARAPDPARAALLQ